jgi:hypothetical protein
MIEEFNDRSVPFDAAALHRLARLTFDKGRPYSVTLAGGLDLVLHALRAHGLLREADRLVDAAQPLVDAANASGVPGLASALVSRSGRPTAAITGRLRCDELETALAAAFSTLGWHDMLPMLATWSPVASRAVADVVLPPDGQVARRELVVDLMRRAAEFEQAWIRQGVGWDLPVFPVDGRTLRASSRLVGLSYAGEVPGEGEVPMSARHANRLGRAVGALALARLPIVLRGHAPEYVVVRALSVLGALAESLRIDTSDVGRRAAHVLRVRGAGVSVSDHGWTPLVWWPVLDSWGSTSKQVRALVPTAWKLPPADADVAVWAVAYATALVGMAADAPDRRLSSAEWEQHVESTLDPVWGLRMDGVWDLFQTTRLVATRSPFPSGFGSPASFGRVDPLVPSSLPWLPGRDES